MTLKHGRIVFLLFLVSGFCGLLYQVVWVRLSYSHFGVITPVLSVVISVFMLGLSLGSWIGGKWITRFRDKLKLSAIVFYAATEFLIGLSGIIVPKMFVFGEKYLLSFGAMDSYYYLLISALTICFSILPWCVLMGFTFPFMMAFVKEIDESESASFSFLYFANVIGAMLGTVITAVILIELVGFKSTLLIAVALNFSVGILSLFLAYKTPYRFNREIKTDERLDEKGISGILPVEKGRIICLILFATGFASMSMEVVWVRAFTPVLKTMTYSFASLLAVYLLATWIGSSLYRYHLKRAIISTEKLLAGISVFALLPIVMNDPRLNVGVPNVLISIFPLCASLGYLTPKLIDQYSSGHPRGAGKAYALNIVGCIIGPLFASYILLPFLGVKMSLIVLSAPFLIFILIYYKESIFKRDWSIIMAKRVK